MFGIHGLVHQRLLLDQAFALFKGERKRGMSSKTLGNWVYIVVWTLEEEELIRLNKMHGGLLSAKSEFGVNPLATIFKLLLIL